MKLIAVTVLVYFMASFLAVGVDSRVTASSSELSIHAPMKEVMLALSRGVRFPNAIIKSGDTISLRWAHSSYQTYWMRCLTSYCYWYSCSGASAKWSACTSYQYYVIYAFGKANGEPIDSGDTVSLYVTNYGSTYRVYCPSSSSSQCKVTSTTSSWSGSSWLYYSYATFQIYSKYANDGTPVQYGDVVGFKFPYYHNSAWLSAQSNNYFYPKSCSRNSKSSCATENSYTGFVIFKNI